MTAAKSYQCLLALVAIKYAKTPNAAKVDATISKANISNAG